MYVDVPTSDECPPPMPLPGRITVHMSLGYTHIHTNTRYHESKACLQENLPVSSVLDAVHRNPPRRAKVCPPRAIELPTRVALAVIRSITPTARVKTAVHILAHLVHAPAATRSNRNSAASVAAGDTACSPRRVSLSMATARIASSALCTRCLVQLQHTLGKTSQRRPSGKDAAPRTAGSLAAL